MARPAAEWEQLSENWFLTLHRNLIGGKRLVAFNINDCAEDGLQTGKSQPSPSRRILLGLCADRYEL